MLLILLINLWVKILRRRHRERFSLMRKAVFIDFMSLAHSHIENSQLKICLFAFFLHARAPVKFHPISKFSLLLPRSNIARSRKNIAHFPNSYCLKSLVKFTTLNIIPSLSLSCSNTLAINVNCLQLRSHLTTTFFSFLRIKNWENFLGFFCNQHKGRFLTIFHFPLCSKS